MRLLLIKHPVNADGSYLSAAHGIWPPGEEREVEEKVARDLLKTWPDAFRPAKAGK